MREFVKFTAALGITLILMLMFRALFFTIYRVPCSSLEPQFKNGDRILVNRCSYGLRTGEDTRSGYTRWMGSRISKGDIAVFNYPIDTAGAVSENPVIAGRCAAVPGDTVIIGSGMRLMVPGKNVPVEVTAQNIMLLCNMLCMHEHKRAYVCNQKLYVNGRETTKVHFGKDYYWMNGIGPHDASGSLYFGFVPEDHVIGRAVMLLYSADSTRHFYECLRRGRFLKLL